MKGFCLVLFMAVSAFAQAPVTVDCSDVSIDVVGGKTSVSCMTPKPPADCPPPVFSVVVSGWPRKDDAATRFSYDPSEPIASVTLEPNISKATFTSIRGCVLAVSK